MFTTVLQNNHDRNITRNIQGSASCRQLGRYPCSTMVYGEIGKLEIMSLYQCIINGGKSQSSTVHDTETVY